MATIPCRKAFTASSMKKGVSDMRTSMAIPHRATLRFWLSFENGKAKVTDTGEQKEVPGSDGEYHYWESDDWYYIDQKGQRIE